MKKTNLSILAMCLILFSCNNAERQKKREQELAKSDSIQKAEKLKAEKKTLDEKARIDSLSQIAWGDAKFGMSFKEAKKTNSFKEAYGYSDKGSPYQTLKLYTSLTKIEGILSIKALFFNDRLYRIEMESYKKTANYWDTDIKSTTYLLEYLIKEKYGSPTKDYGFPEFHKMRPDNYYDVYEWNIDKKRMLIQVGEVYGGSEYRVICIIYNRDESEAPLGYEMEQNHKEQKNESQNNGF